MSVVLDEAGGGWTLEFVGQETLLRWPVRCELFLSEAVGKEISPYLFLLAPKSPRF